MTSDFYFLFLFYFFLSSFAAVFFREALFLALLTWPASIHFSFAKAAAVIITTGRQTQAVNAQLQVLLQATDTRQTTRQAY